MSDRVSQILKEVESLSGDEQAQLLSHLLAARGRSAGPAPAWRDVMGIAAPSLLEEDAQAWVSRGREESDRAREIGLKGGE